MRIVEITKDAEPCLYRYPALSLDAVRKLFVHRTSFAHADPQQNPAPMSDEELTGMDIAARFRSFVALGTGRRVAYHLIIRSSGVVEQLLPLDVRGAHAIGQNYCSWGVAAVGDFDVRPMADNQRAMLVELLRFLRTLRPGAEIFGHTEVPGTSSDPEKRCPGRYLDMDLLRKDVGTPEAEVDLKASFASAISAGLILNSRGAL
jgi:N-acetyl-anhydromuramyl-L-alanine amidase AmpD